jgi:nucleoside-diphosphate-sugar epimerase
VNVLITGGAGYVGGALTDALLTTSHEVRVFDLLLYEDTYRKPVEFIKGDVTSISALRPHLDWADCVVWLAARVAEATCDLDPIAAEEVNVRSVAALCQHFQGRIVFTSTAAVYGRSAGVLTEESPLEPRTLYSRTKVRAEELLGQKNALILRLGTLFGLGDLFSRPRFDLVVNTMTLAASIDRKVTVIGGEQYRPFLHVRDAADALAAATATTATGVYNLAGENLQIKELALRLQRHFDNLSVDTLPEPGQLESYRMSIERARRALGFKPRRTVDDGIAEVRQLIESGRIPDLESVRFRNHLALRNEGVYR